jgi:hypothetical protein
VYIRGILHDVHAFLDDMHSEASWPDLVEWATTQFLAISGSAAIYEHDLQARSSRSGPFSHAPARHLNRLPRTASVRVPNNIRQRFVNCASHSAAFRLGKAQLLGKAHHCTSYYGQHFGIAQQLEPEQPARETHLGFSLSNRTN